LFVVGPTLLQFNALTQGVGDYFSQLVPMSPEHQRTLPRETLR